MTNIISYLYKEIKYHEDQIRKIKYKFYETNETLRMKRQERIYKIINELKEMITDEKY